MRLAVVGAGWAGLACAVRAVEAGHEVSVFEMAPMPGGRARSDANDSQTDNGQHILLGGYARTLALMRTVGVDPALAFDRQPLALCTPDGRGIMMRAGRWPRAGAAAALWRSRGLDARDKWNLLWLATRWQLTHFRCDARLTVDDMLRRTARPGLRRLLLDPLCVSALNTDPVQASAAVYLAVLRDGVFGAPGDSDMLLPRWPLSSLLPGPAVDWLRAHGATVRFRQRVTAIERTAGGWQLCAESGQTAASLSTDRVVLACAAGEAARLTGDAAPTWAAQAGALAHEPIVTLVARMPRRTWPRPMLALESDAHRPAQFAFHRGSIDAEFDRVALVCSAASGWIERGMDAVTTAMLAQCRQAFDLGDADPLQCLDARVDRRATFRCDAGLQRPPARIAEGLWAAGDYVAGPYPATLEAAVRAGEAALAD